MNINEAEDQMIQLVASDNLPECLQEIKQYIRPKDYIFKQDLAHLEARYSAWKRGVIRGIGDSNKAALNEGFLHFIERLFSHRRDELFCEKILLVTHNGKAYERILKYLNPEFFDLGNVEKAINELRPDLAAGRDFVLFDTFHMDNVDFEYSRELMKKYLEQAEVHVLLLFGPPDEIMNNTIKSYRQKFFAANSPFSLYARIRELREFLKIHGIPEQQPFD